ncbi:hypothetical protein BK133_00825 [Paenibacillus sp. FSL H8-0548]|uniref:hypothetical protein n=1 Tax=Paenibacillus sp. FSL H8-0548 TaxID=1920422 RepID=UPI00096FE134|nr:hypothetical protein [Paenibacillus sp. FSL H8-0548]OMF38780.1 hypothetical protein BK133_00825 [Paenibacillus sp. FSL H8-0548]
MEYAIMGIVFGLCLFIVPLWAYRRGLQDGLGIRRDKPIQPITPIIPKPFEKAKASVEEDKMMQGMQNLMSYDPFQPPKKEGEA